MRPSLAAVIIVLLALLLGAGLGWGSLRIISLREVLWLAALGFTAWCAWCNFIIWRRDPEEGRLVWGRLMIGPMVLLVALYSVLAAASVQAMFGGGP
jgi:hypothetical protein